MKMLSLFQFPSGTKNMLQQLQNNKVAQVLGLSAEMKSTTQQKATGMSYTHCV